MDSTVQRVFNTLRATLPGATALALVGADGNLVAHAAGDSRFDAETFVSEHAMLLRIVQRTAEDTGMGNVSEHILVSDVTLMLARRLPSMHFAILLCKPMEPLGRVRYELKRASRELERSI